MTEETFCDPSTIDLMSCPKMGNKRICRCTHRVKYKLGSIAELVVVNLDDNLPHPMHLHGHKFHVVGSGYLPRDMTVEEVKRNGTIHQDSINKRPPYKDTVGGESSSIE